MSKRHYEEIVKRGQASEVKFQRWLDRSKVAYTYFDQSPETFAADFRATTKRPDFLIGIPTIGSIGVDVKAKKATDDFFYLDAKECQLLAQFEFAFAVPVWYAIIRAGATNAYLIPNASVTNYEIVETNVGPAHPIYFDDFYRCNPDKLGFYDAIFKATCAPYD